jgi:Protein of unknown function (DUF1573)
MKKTILFFALCVSFGICNAQTVAVADPHAGHDHAKQVAVTEAKSPSMSVANEVAKPIIEETLVVKENEFDFGKIPQGKPVTHVFNVTNAGKTPFKLENVQASCGCTTPVWDKEKVIAPGTTSEITVGYNAAAEGPFTKPVTITYNGTQSKVITIKGIVWKTPTESAPTNGAINDLKN